MEAGSEGAHRGRVQDVMLLAALGASAILRTAGVLERTPLAGATARVAACLRFRMCVQRLLRSSRVQTFFTQPQALWGGDAWPAPRIQMPLCLRDWCTGFSTHGGWKLCEIWLKFEEMPIAIPRTTGSQASGWLHVFNTALQECVDPRRP